MNLDTAALFDQSMSQIHVALIAVEAMSHCKFRAPLIRALTVRGVKVSVLASNFEVSSKARISELGAEPVDITMARTGMNPFTDMRDTFRLVSTLSRLKPEIVLSSFIKPVIFGTLAAWLARVPRRIAMIEGLGFVYTDNGVAPGIKTRSLRAMVSSLYRLALKRAHRVIFLNPDDMNDFSSLQIVDRDKATLLGGIGVDLEEWTCKTPVSEPIRFLFVGRLLDEKGINDFIEAARIMKRSRSNIEFVVLGAVDSNPGSISTEQMNECVKFNLLIWPGHVHVKPWICRSSVFVLPSYREGLPRSTQEAMAMGRPVITTDVPGCRQTVVDGRNGYLVPVRDPEALANAMIRFVDYPELIAQMGKESRRLAEERFDVHEVNARLIQILGL